MSGTGDKGGQSGRGPGRLERRSPDLRWAELLDSTGWSRSPITEPSRKEAPAPLVVPPPKASVTPEVLAAPLAESAPTIDSAPKGDVAPAPDIWEPSAKWLAPLLAEAEAPAPNQPPAPSGHEPDLPVSNAGLFNDWAKIEGAGWDGSAARTARPSPPSPFLVATPSSSIVQAATDHRLADHQQNDVRDAIAESNQTLQALRREILELETKRNDLLSELATTEKEATDKRDVLAQLTRDLAAIRVELAEKAAEGAALRDEIEARATDIANQQTMVAEMSAHFATLTEDVAAARERLTQDHQALNTLTSKRSQLETALEPLAEEHRRHHVELAVLEQETQEVSERLAEARTNLEERQRALAQTQDALAAAHRHHETLVAQREETALSLSSLRDERSRLAEAITASQAELDRIQGERLRLDEIHAAARAAAQAAELNLTAIQEKISAASKRHHDGIVATKETLRQRDLAAEEIAGLTRQSQALRDEIKQAQEERARSLQDLKERQQEFQTVYNRDKRLLNKLQREIAGVQRELEQLKKQRGGIPAEAPP